jgi:predicted PurR-regulated permease PerM
MQHPERRRTSADYTEFLNRVLIVLLVVALAVLVWKAADILLLAFGAVLIGQLVWLVAEPFSRWGRLSHRAALVAAAFLILICLGGTLWLFGSRMANDFSDVLARAGSAVTQLRAGMQQSEFGRFILGQVGGGGGLNLPSLVSRFLSLSITTLEAALILVITAAYLTAQPALYREGLVQLFPRRLRPEIDELLGELGRALRLWLLGQFIQMAIIGAMSTLAVWLIGLPSPLALGVIAGVAEFIPYVGPVLAAIPALLVAFTQGSDAAVWTLVAYILIHQAEGHLVAPLVQLYMISIPPAMLLVVIATVGVIFGPLGLFLAAPLTVMLYVAVKKLWVRDTLKEPTTIPGEE